MFKEIKRVLKENGKCLLFCQEPFTQKLLNERIFGLDFNYKIFWNKERPANILGCKKAMTNQIEEILLFTKSINIYNYVQNHPLRSYAKKIKNYINKGESFFIKKYGNRQLNHFLFCCESSQFSICSEKSYNNLINDFKINELDYFLKYSELKEINSKFLDSLNLPKSTFNLWEGGKQKKNLLTYKKDNTKLHPTQKPILLLEDLIKTYSNKNETVLDFTMGSGSTGEACINTNRNFIGFELDDNFFNIAKKRLEEKQKEKTL